MVDLTRERDVVIVGAGPGGTGAAYWLSKIGLDTLVLEAKKFPRIKPCGDGIGPRAVLALEKMGLRGWLESSGAYRIDRLRIVAPSGASIASSADADMFPITHGFVVKRADFDHKLANHAAEAGAEIAEGFRAEQVIFENGRAKGIKGRFDDAEYKIKAKLIVVADGSTGAISRLFGAKIGRPQAVGLRAYARDVAGIDDCANIFFNSAFPRGYGWVFPTGPDSANIGVGLLGIDNKSRGSQSIHAAFDRFAKEQNLTPISLTSSVIEGRPFGSVMRMNFGRRPSRQPGLAFIGDAAGLVSPINGEGISHAIESGQALAEQLADKFSSPAEIDAALQGYDTALNHKFLSYFRWGRLLGTALSKPERLSRLIAKSQKHDEVRIALTGILANTVHPRELARLKVMFKILF